MKIKLYSFLLTLCLLPMLACGQSKSKPRCDSKFFDATVRNMLHFTVPTISCEALHAEASKYILLDARERSEYDVSHIKSAQYIGYEQFDANVLSKISKDAPIVVYCSIGVRSEKIGEKLQKLGYNNVKNLYGSIFEWVNKGYEVVDNSGNTSLKVHSYNQIWGQYIKNKKMQKVN